MKLKPVKSYLRHSNRERRSFFYLVFFLFILASIYFIVHFRTRPRSYILNPLSREQKDNVDLGKDSVADSTVSLRSLKKFDPNKVDAPALVSMGLPSKVARNWLKYLKAGGRFKDIQSISRIYGMTPEWRKVLEPYLDFGSRTGTPVQVVSVSTITEKPRATEFDPNSAEAEQFISCGLPGHLAKVIVNYRTKGGSFNRPEDLSKIFGMTDSLLLLIKPFMKFQSQENPSAPAVKNYVDINRSDTTAWKQLPGIGTVLARRIVGFRESLGGFVRPEQLAEVFGLRDSTLQAILPFLLPSPLFRKIEINKALPLDRPHPYLSVKDSRTIANFIRQNGEITSPDGLNRLLGFDEKFWERLLPYLDFEAVNAH